MCFCKDESIARYLAQYILYCLHWTFVMLEEVVSIQVHGCGISVALPYIGLLSLLEKVVSIQVCGCGISVGISLH